MHTCDNCKAEFPLDKGVVTTYRTRLVSSVCEDCCSNARTVKLVLKKREVGGFAYEQFQAIEMVKAAG